MVFKKSPSHHFCTLSPFHDIWEKERGQGSFSLHVNKALPFSHLLLHAVSRYFFSQVKPWLKCFLTNCVISERTEAARRAWSQPAVVPPLSWPSGVVAASQWLTYERLSRLLQIQVLMKQWQKVWENSWLQDLRFKIQCRAERWVFWCSSSLAFGTLYGLCWSAGVTGQITGLQALWVDLNLGKTTIDVFFFFFSRHIPTKSNFSEMEISDKC